MGVYRIRIRFLHLPFFRMCRLAYIIRLPKWFQDGEALVNNYSPLPFYFIYIIMMIIIIIIYSVVSLLKA